MSFLVFAHKCFFGKNILHMTTIIDLNLIHALDALLEEGSVTAAAQRAHITTPAMSRALGRLRTTLGDQLLVRAGRSMVRTQFAVSIRARVRFAALEANAVLRPAKHVSIESVHRTLVIRCSDAVAAVLAGPLSENAVSDAPGIRVCFVAEGDEDAAPLRDGRIDLDIGVVDFTEPELRSQLLLRDHFVAVVRKGHELCNGRATAKRLASFNHIAVSRRGRASGPIDSALTKLGLQRQVTSVVPTFFSALFATSDADLVTAVPRLIAEYAARWLPIELIKFPFELPPLPIVQLWHPRVDDDPAHRWLRQRVRALMTGMRVPTTQKRAYVDRGSIRVPS
jgi:DNA-binding transcriptional LysR family regulator